MNAGMAPTVRPEDAAPFGEPRVEGRGGEGTCSTTQEGVDADMQAVLEGTGQA